MSNSRAMHEGERTIRMLCGLAANPALPPELIDRLIALTDIADMAAEAGDASFTDLADSLAGRADLSRPQSLALAARSEGAAVSLAYEGKLTAGDVDPVTRPQAALALLDQGAGRSEWARRFAVDPDAGHRVTLAGCPGLPPDVVETLAADPDLDVVAELALFAPPEVAARLAEHPHTAVRCAVAANEATPPAVLAALLTGDGLPPARWCPDCAPEPGGAAPPDAPHGGDHEAGVQTIRQLALRNPATPTEAVIAFADDPSAVLRWELAARADLPPGTGARLATDPLPGVRGDLAANPAIDEALIRTLATDRVDTVRRDLAHHPRVPLDVLADLARTTRIGPTLLPRIAAASAAEVTALAASPHPAVRMLLAVRRDLPPAIRDALATDPDAKVLAAIAPHPGLPDALLHTMADRHGVRVAGKVAANPDASPALLEELSRREPPARKALREIARHPHATPRALAVCLTDPRARPLAAAHPALPSHIATDLLTDSDDEVAEAAATNPALPRATMDQLIARGEAAHAAAASNAATAARRDSSSVKARHPAK
ncbi:hypothetical protein [Streptomyces coffeae]|uniref:hypothetical protein n=1 Tax=Streptomyces coffeae TaxID=621382 RepID=UPI001F44CE76|nr:hypothetical protein [Streptomyces coffeae]